MSSNVAKKRKEFDREETLTSPKRRTLTSAFPVPISGHSEVPHQMTRTISSESDDPSQENLHIRGQDQDTMHPIPKTTVLDKVEAFESEGDLRDMEVEYVVPQPVHPAYIGTASNSDTALEVSTDHSSGSNYRTRICVLVPGDRDGTQGEWMTASLDTQAECSIVFQSRLQDSKLKPTYRSDLKPFRGLGSRLVPCVGYMHITFLIKGNVEEPIEDKVFVLEDEEDRCTKPPFDILISRNVIARHELITINKDKVPHAFCAGSQED